MYETRKFYLRESITVSDLLNILTNVCDRFIIESANRKEMIDSLRASIARAREHAFALYHQVNERKPEGNYYEIGIMNVEGLGIIACLEFDKHPEHKTPSLITNNFRIEGFVLHSTIPSWKSIFSDAEQKKVFDDLELLIISELIKISVNIRKIVSERKWVTNYLKILDSLCSVFFCSKL